jgi:hypothetical protein
MAERQGVVFVICCAAWILVGIAASSFFYFNRNAAIKRRVLPLFVIGMGTFFLGILAMAGISARDFLIIVPFLLLISYFKLRTIKFCDHCGRTVGPLLFFFPPQRCHKCGAHLAATDAHTQK